VHTVRCWAVPGCARWQQLLGVRCWVGDGDIGGHGCEDVHGVCGGAVQQRIYGGVHRVRGRVDDGHAGCWECDGVHRVCGGALQRGVDISMCCVRCWAVPGYARWQQLLGVWRWGGDGDIGGYGCEDVHGVCGRAVQQRIDGGVRRVRGRMDDASSGCWECDGVHRVCGGALQRCVDIGMPSVSCGISDGHTAGCRRHDLHSMPRGAVHQHIDHGLCGLSIWNFHKCQRTGVHAMQARAI
jgi:hypothetical protein